MHHTQKIAKRARLTTSVGRYSIPTPQPHSRVNVLTSSEMPSKTTVLPEGLRFNSMNRTMASVSKQRDTTFIVVVIDVDTRGEGVGQGDVKHLGNRILHADQFFLFF